MAAIFRFTKHFYVLLCRGMYNQALSAVSHRCLSDSYLYDIDGLVQDCSNSIPNALELLQSCAK